MWPSQRVFLALLTLILVAGPAFAGEVDPPTGAVGPTMKTLAQIEPRIPINAQTCPGGPTWVYGITQPGSYYLESDLVGESGKYCIRIAPDNVTIDLNGFTLIGVPGSSSAIDGGVFEASNVTVRNGTIRGFGDRAIRTEATASGWRVENVRATYNGSGIILPRQSVITNCIANDNVGTGFAAIWGSTFEGCIANGGARGFSAGFGTTLTNCAAQYNDESGFTVYAGSSAIGCAARSNGTVGFLADDGATLTNCTASENGLDGISLGEKCAATGNTCNGNGPQAQGAGIRTTGQRNRVQENSLTGNYYPIRSEAANNFFIQNTASGNFYILGYAFDAGDTYGPTVSVTGAIASTSPWANFLH